jgi:hypothetical protein
MITAKCHRCGGIALGETLENASAKINHAVGLSRGIKCGDSYGQVKQIGTTVAPKEKPKDFLFTEHKDKKPTQNKTETFKKVDEKSKKSK